MKLYRRDNGIWFLSYRDELGSKRQKSTGLRDRVAAEQEAQRILRGEHPTRKLRYMTLERALWDTFNRIWSKQKSAREKRYMVAALARSKLGGMEVDALTYPVLSEWVEALLATGLAPATVNRKLASISKALGECVKMGYLTSVPPMPHQPERNVKVRWLTHEEERLLMIACGHVLPETDAHHMRSLIVFLVDTGARLGEARKVAGQVPLRGQVTFEQTKSKDRSRTVPLTERAAEALSLLPDWNKNRCIRLFTRVRDKAGLPDVSLHILRHTCASRLVQGGMDLYRVKQWLGHSTIQVTERYAHLASSNLTEGADILVQNGASGCQGGTSGAHQQNAPNLRVVK